MALTKNIFATLCLLFFLFTPAFAQTDTVNLSQLEISSSRIPVVYSESSRIISVITKDQIQNAAVSDIQDLLKFVAGVDCRQRGVDGVQSDISIRGGTAEQALILLNGIPMNDPQTGHHTLNLPVDIQCIQRIEVLEGPGSRVYGPNAFSGAINIITGSDENNNLNISLQGGDYNLFAGFASYSLITEKTKQYLSLSKKQSDGFMANTDFNIGQFFYQAGMKFKKDWLDFQGGYCDKAFGANSFYSSKYPNQFENTGTAFASAMFSKEGKIQSSYAAYWRANRDRFELFRNFEGAPSWYTGHNYHFTNVLGCNLNYSVDSKMGKTAFGGEFRNESIVSNVLGDPLNDMIPVPSEANAFYTKAKSRRNISVYLDHAIDIKKITASAGLLLNGNSDFGWNVYPGIDLSYHLTSKLKWIASLNESMRMPTFTDLYYSSATNIGNPNLKPESCITYETGVKYLGDAIDAQFAAFRKEGKNLIDWVRFPDSVKWESRNLTEINTVGLEFTTHINLRTLTHHKNFFISQAAFSYSYLYSSKIEKEFVSKYVLDYLVHKADLSLMHKIYKNVYATWNMSWQDRNGTYIDFSSQLETPYDPVFLLNAKVLWQRGFLQAYIEAANLLDVSYYDYGNIIMPGRWISGGVKINFDLNKKE